MLLSDEIEKATTWLSSFLKFTDIKFPNVNLTVCNETLTYKTRPAITNGLRVFHDARSTVKAFSEMRAVHQSCFWWRGGDMRLCFLISCYGTVPINWFRMSSRWKFRLCAAQNFVTEIPAVIDAIAPVAGAYAQATDATKLIRLAPCMQKLLRLPKDVRNR